MHFTFSLTPYTRGKQFEKMSADNQLRITPVYAGNTYLPGDRLGAKEDHPRLCGEYSLRSCGSSARLGSPPSMRGILGFECLKLVHKGITPVYAGNTIEYISKKKLQEDHPRLCGEYFLNVSASSIWKGSPPSMRGIRTRKICYQTVTRITPVYAGNTGISDFFTRTF